MNRPSLAITMAGLLVTACEPGEKLTPSDLRQPDTGSMFVDEDAGRDMGVEDLDAGTDAGEPECWHEINIIGDQGDLQDLGKVLLSVGDTAYAAAAVEASAPGGPSWRLFRFSQDTTGQWQVDRSVTGVDIGSSGTEVVALIENEGRLWVGIRGARGSGEVLSVSLDLDDASPMLQAPAAGASFGSALAANERTLFVGDPNRRGGAVDLFDIQDQPALYLRTFSSSTSGTSVFGSSLALKDDRLLVGAPSSCIDDNCSDTGAVVEYRLEGSQWQLHDTTNSSNSRFRLYGDSITWAGDDALVSAPRSYHCVDECYSTTDSPEPGTGGCPANLKPCLFAGAASLESSSSPVELLPSSLGTDQVYNLKFGETIAANDRWIALGSPSDKSCLFASPLSVGCTGAGAVHIFSKGLGTVTPVKYLKPTDISPNAFFGSSVSLGDNHLVVGAYDHCGAPIGSRCSKSGAIYFFSTCE